MPPFVTLPRQPSRSFVLVVAPVVASFVACHTGRSSTAPTGGDDSGFECFTAEADGAEPAQSVFDELGRTGNGYTWGALIRNDLEREARLGETIDVEEMGVGWQIEVEFRGRRSWIGFDEEGGGAVFCTPDSALLQHLRSAHEHLRTDPDALRDAIRSIPEESWDD